MINRLKAWKNALVYSDNKAIQFMLRLSQQVVTNNVKGDAAQLAYYFIFALVPLMIFFINVISFFAADKVSAILEWMAFLPLSVQEILVPIIQSIIGNRSEALLSAGIFVALWSGSNGVSQAIKATNAIFAQEDNRNMILTRIMAIFYTILVILLVVALLVLNVFNTMIPRLVEELFSVDISGFILWQSLGTLLPYGFIVIIFTLFYKTAPAFPSHTSLPFRHALIGGIFVTIGIMVSTLAYAFFVNNISHMNATYGSLTGVMALFVWLYLVGLMIILGAEIIVCYLAVFKGIEFQNLQSLPEYYKVKPSTIFQMVHRMKKDNKPKK